MNVKKSIDELLEAILLLQNRDEIELFFRDLLTSGELEEFAKRWKTAKMLDSKISYATIVKKTGLSSTTVARVSKWLQGEGGGYQLVLKRMQNMLNNQ